MDDVLKENAVRYKAYFNNQRLMYIFERLIVKSGNDKECSFLRIRWMVHCGLSIEG